MRCHCCGSALTRSGSCPSCDARMSSPPHPCLRRLTVVTDEHGCPPPFHRLEDDHVRITGPVLDIEDVDMLDGTPLLDIKPYIPAFGERDGVRIGWFTDRLDASPSTVADDRFG